MGILLTSLFIQYMAIDSHVMIENFKNSYSTSKSHVEYAAKDARKRSNAAVKKQNKAAQKQNKKNKKKNKNSSDQRGQNTSSYSDTNDNENVAEPKVTPVTLDANAVDSAVKKIFSKCIQ